MPQAPKKMVTDIIRPQKKVEQKISQKMVMFLSLTLLLIVSLGLGWLWMTSEIRAVQRDTYQAVTLTNNQLYFGKITKISDQSVTLKDTYYIVVPTSSENKPSEVTDATVLRSIKKAAYSPQDTVEIQRENVVYWQNLQKDSQVVKTITAQ